MLSYLLLHNKVLLPFYYSSQFGGQLLRAWLLGALPHVASAEVTVVIQLEGPMPSTSARMAERLGPAGAVHKSARMWPLQGGTLGLLRLLPPQPGAAKESVPRDGGRGCQCL